MMDKENILVTCGLPYANGNAHIAHLRTYVPGDAFVRFLRKSGKKVLFVCGSDTHGAPIMANAEKQGITPKELVDIYHKKFKETFEKVNVHFDYYGSTDSKTNYETTREIGKKLYEKKYIYPKEIECFYCEKCKKSLPDRYLVRTCPYCGKKARGDECDQGCGRFLSEQDEMIDPRCSICNSIPKKVIKKHYFFKLTSFKKFLETYLKNLGGTKIAKTLALGWIKKGLQDWCITRDYDWGIKTPFDKNLTFYVWFDAPIGYLSATKEASEEWKKYWKGKNYKIIHFIGGDIIYHHCLFWPSMLKGSGYNTATDVVASGMMTIFGHKFSKSRGYVVFIDELFEEGIDIDAVRYYILSYTGHAKDLEFNWDEFFNKFNNELVNNLSNFVYRTSYFAYKNFGKIPKAKIEKEVVEKINSSLKEYEKKFNAYDFNEACNQIMSLSSFGNEYFQRNKPWETIDSDKELCEKTILNCMQLIKALALMVEPIMPKTAERMWNFIEGTNVHEKNFDQAVKPLVTGKKLVEPEYLFKKLEEKKLRDLKQKTEERIKRAEQAEQKKEQSTVGFDEFKKIDLRTAVIKSVEEIKDSDKLLKLKVKIGNEEKQIVAGIKKDYSKEELIGKTIILVNNLEPAVIKGEKSEAMLLAADMEGRAVLLTPDKKVEDGLKIR